MSESPKKVKFVASDADGLPLKRKQVQQACDSCRKKKKRCVHTGNCLPARNAKSSPFSSSPEHPLEETETDGRTSVSTVVPRRTDDDTSTAASNLVEFANVERISDAQAAQDGGQGHHPSRFVGDLNPESLFIEATAPKMDRTTLGIWSSDPNREAGDIPPSPVTSPKHLSVQYDINWFKKAQRQFLETYCLHCLPSDTDYQQLLNIYREQIYPVFPIISASSEGPGSGDESPTEVIALRQAICLAAATSPDATQRLRLRRYGDVVLPFFDFSHYVSQSLMELLASDLVPNRIVRTRLYAILALFFQPRKDDDCSLQTSFASRAVHEVTSLGMHLCGYRKASGSCDYRFETLFCAIWALDRINASLHARPINMHERDIERNLETAVGNQEPCFKLLLIIVSECLEPVIDLYRPRRDRAQSANVNLPIFESLVVDAGALNVPSRLLATMEIFYHAIAILSVPRPPMPPVSGADQAAAPPGAEAGKAHLPPAVVNTRRSLGADRIRAVVGCEAIYRFPFVPYAVSLALSVEYLKMRYSRVPMFKSRALCSFRDDVKLLDQLRTTSWPARNMYLLGDCVLKQMEKTISTMTTTHGGRGAGASANGADHADEGAAGGGGGGGGGGYDAGEVAIRTNRASAERNGEPTAHDGASLFRTVEQAAPPVAAASLPAQNDFGFSSLDSAPRNLANIGSMAAGTTYGFSTSTLPSAAMDVSVFSSMPDMDLFNHFDPGFDLGAVDAALESNLDCAVPSTYNWIDWDTMIGSF